MNVEFATWALLGLSLATGLVAGVFLTFSDFVMKSLAESSPAAGTEAMQIINRKVYRSIFMVLLMGLIPVTGILAGFAFLGLEGAIANLLITAGLLYVLGVFVVSAVGNIPMNKKLDAMPLGGAEAQAYWPTYIRSWVAWNHIRWVTASGAAGCYMAAAIALAKSV